MASNSPETEGRKRKDSIGQLKRDRPLFTARRFGPSQKPTDFFTDSLNNSSIPSPSPTKENTQPGIRAKPRPKLGTPRSLAASFKATSEINNHSHRPSSPPSPDQTPRIYAPNSRPVQTDVRNQAKTPSKPTNLPRRVKTTDPPRGRQLPIASPSSSASSPPRGLAEAYQRIQNEENLAEEDTVDDDTAYDYSDREERREHDRIRTQITRDTTSSIPLRASEGSSPGRSDEGYFQTGNQTKEMEHNSHQSESESGRSIPDNLTENSSTGELSQYTKDLLRVNRAMNSGPLFTKRTRVGDTASLTRLKLPDRSDESSDSARGAESVSSAGSKLYANVPPQWGRKSRPGKDWLNRINTKNGIVSGDSPKPERVDALPPEKTVHDEALEGWVVTGADGSKTGEDRALQPATSREHAPAAESRKRSLERVEEWELNEDDFTGRSLQASDSPPIRVRNATLDPIIEREIDSLARRAVTTNRLGEIRVKRSEENLGRKLRSQSVEDLSHQNIDSDRDSLRRKRSSLKFPLKPFVDNKSYSSISGAVLGSGGDPVPNSPITIYRSTSNASMKDNGASGVKIDGEKVASRRPSHGRADSRDLLRELARATSQSSTPTKEGIVADIASDKTAVEKASSGEIQPEFDSPAMDQTPQMTEESKPLGNERLPEKAEIDKQIQQTPRQSKPLRELKTPLVTGAWIDTPLPVSGHGPPSPAPTDLEEEYPPLDSDDYTPKVTTTHLIRKLNPHILSPRPKAQPQRALKDTGPVLPKSALESIITAAKSKSRSTSSDKSKSAMKLNRDSDEDPTLQLSESTIQSLEKMLENDDSEKPTPTVQSLPSPSSILRDDDQSVAALPSPPPSPLPVSLEDGSSESRPTTTAQPSRLSELQSYARQMTRLGNVGPSIRDAKRRLSNIEKAISSSVATSPLKSKSSTPQNECEEAGEFHDFIWPCERCGCTARRDLGVAAQSIAQGGDMTTISIPVPKLWKWRPDDWRPRLTWLGMVALVGALWWMGDWIAW